MPLLPAMATIKLCACGPLIATTGSAPKRDATLMLLTSNKFALYVQVNSALVYPSAGTLFKLTVTNAVSPRLISLGLITVDTYGPDNVGVGDAILVGVFVICVVGVGVGVGSESSTFKSGLNSPTVTRPFVKVVLLNNELYLTSHPANVAPIVVGRSRKCKCGTLIS